MQIIIAKQNYLKKMGEELKYIDGFDVTLIICRNCSIRYASRPICAPTARPPQKKPPSSSQKRKIDHIKLYPHHLPPHTFISISNFVKIGKAIKVQLSGRLVLLLSELPHDEILLVLSEYLGMLQFYVLVERAFRPA